MTARSKSYIMGKAGPFKPEGRYGACARNCDGFGAGAAVRGRRLCGWLLLASHHGPAVHENDHRFHTVTCHLPTDNGQPDDRGGRRNAQCGSWQYH